MTQVYLEKVVSTVKTMTSSHSKRHKPNTIVLLIKNTVINFPYNACWPQLLFIVINTRWDCVNVKI